MGRTEQGEGEKKGEKKRKREERERSEENTALLELFIRQKKIILISEHLSSSLREIIINQPVAFILNTK